MNPLNARIYASVEIKQQVLIFCVSRIIKQKMMVVFKREVPNQQFWLNENNEVMDPTLTARVLRSLIDEYEMTHDGFKILKISLILPAVKLKISEKYKEISINKNLENQKATATELQINELKNNLKTAAWNTEYAVIDTQPLTWKIDDKLVKKNQISQIAGYKLGLTAMVYEIPAKVLATHEKVINLCECSTMLVTTNISELHGLIKNDYAINPAVIITNWNENNLEVGYFEAGILKNFKVIKGGMNLLINNFAHKMKLKIETAKNYIFNLIDFTSNHNLTSDIYQKWDAQQKILRKYNGLEITKVLFYELQMIYQQIQNVAQYSDVKLETENYNFGLIQEIPGAEKLFQTGNRFNHEHVYQSRVFGARLNANYNAIIGVNKTLEKINNDPNNHSVYTSVGTFNRQPTRITDPYPTSQSPNLTWWDKPLFLKHEGVLVDYQKAKNKGKD